MYVYHNNNWVLSDNDFDNLKIIFQQLIKNTFEDYKNTTWESVPKNIILDKMTVGKLKSFGLNENDLMTLRIIKRVFSFLSSSNSLSDVMKFIKLNAKSFCDENVIFDVSKELYNTLQFKNGYLNLDTNTFHQRSKEMYVSKWLNYDYKEYDEVPQECHDKVEEIFRQIHTSEDDRNDDLSFLKTLLYGGNENSYFKINVGDGSNGKSILSKIHRTCLPTYSLLANKKAVEGKEKDRFLYSAIFNPVRVIFGENIKKADDIKTYSGLAETEIKNCLATNRFGLCFSLLTFFIVIIH